jgi:hypothetical protein
MPSIYVVARANNRCRHPGLATPLVEVTGLLARVCLPVGSIEEAGQHAEGLDHPKHRETFLSF